MGAIQGKNLEALGKPLTLSLKKLKNKNKN
jgi:hypothetical protein